MIQMAPPASYTVDSSSAFRHSIQLNIHIFLGILILSLGLLNEWPSTSSYEVCCSSSRLAEYVACPNLSLSPLPLTSCPSARHHLPKPGSYFVGQWSVRILIMPHERPLPLLGHDSPSVNRLYPSVGTHELQSSRSEASPPKIAFGCE